MTRIRHRLRVLEAAAILTLIGLLMGGLPFNLLMRLVGLPINAAPPKGGLSPLPLARAVDAAVSAAAKRLPWHPVCLPQAFAAGLMLRWRGYSPELCFGIQKTSGTLAAHAWLTLDGGIVCGGQMDPALVPFTPSPAP